MRTLRKIPRRHRGFLTYGPTLDSLSSRDREEEEGEEAGRFPAAHFADYDNDTGELVIRAGESPQETDPYSMDARRRPARAHDRDSKGLPVPHTLSAMNKYFARHYGRGGRRSQPVR